MAQWSYEDKPVWKQTWFSDLFGDRLCSIEEEQGHGWPWTRCSKAFLPPINLLILILQRAFDVYGTYEISALLNAAKTAEFFASIDLVRNEDLSNVLELVTQLTYEIAKLQENQFLWVPVCWLDGDENDPVGFCVLIILKRDSDDRFTLWICNTNSTSMDASGLSYHAAGMTSDEFDDPIPHVSYKLSLKIPDIPLRKLNQSWFWFVLFRMSLGPQRKMTGAKLFYEVLIPYLTSTPLSAIIYDNLQDLEKNPDLFSKTPLSGDHSLIWCVLEAVNVVGRNLDLNLQIIRGALFHEIIQLILADLELLWQYEDNEIFDRFLTSEEARLISFALKRVARLVVTKSVVFEENQDTKNLKDMLMKIRRMTKERSEDFEDYPSFLPEDLTFSYEYFDGFDRFRRIKSVEGLAGVAELKPYIRPVQFTLISETVETYQDIINVLRHCDSICTLLSNQAEHIANSHALRVTLIEYVFTRVTPIPLPKGHPRENECIYRQDLLYDSQVGLLRLIRLLSRHFSAACMSLRIGFDYDSSRILTMACMATISDAVIRLEASDIPSMFSLHIDGNAPKTMRFFLKPFGFDMGPFAAQSQYLSFISPELVTTRTRILDYFTAQELVVSQDHLIFDFEKSSTLGNLQKLLIQVCWEQGLDDSLINEYVTGENAQLNDIFPEFEYYRDIVFTFKYMMSPTTDALPPVRCWNHIDATLEWKCNEGDFLVFAFDQQLMCVIPELKEEYNEKEVASKGGIFTFLNKKRYRVFKVSRSGASASSIVGQRIDTEEDVLHIDELPSFDGRLSQKESELLISYLTVPYIRIPLILNFFARERVVSALSSPTLQLLVQAVVFEPELFKVGKWDVEQRKISMIVDEDISVDEMEIPLEHANHLATPCGLLLNEITKSPEAILSAVLKIVKLALEHDIGKYTPNSASFILFCVRLLVRIEGFVSYVLEHYEWNLEIHEGKGYAVNLSGARSVIRGLDITDEVANYLYLKKAKMRDLLANKIFRMLQFWLDDSVKNDEIGTACIIYTHLAYIFHNAAYDDFDETVVTMLLTSNIFLTSRHEFTISPFLDDLFKRTDFIQDPGLGLAEIEVFQMFQKQRAPLIKWLNNNPDLASEVLENVIQLVSMNRRSLLSQNTVEEAEGFKTRYWRNMDGRNCIGRYIPDARLRSPREQVEAEIERPHTRGIEGTDVEVNVQLGTLTLHTNSLYPLPENIVKMPDFIEVFGSNAKNIQYADVKPTSERQWMRLMGYRHDLQLWTPDERVPSLGRYSVGIAEMPQWFQDSFKTVSLLPFLQEIEFFGPDSVADNDAYIMVGGHIYNDDEKIPWIVEVGVYRYPIVFHVFVTEKYGRRFYRSLVFTSDSSWCYQDTSRYATSELESGRYGNPGENGLRRLLHLKQSRSLNIFRNFGVSQNDNQMLIPARFLYGLLPSILLEQYQFWQNADDNLTGYPSKEFRRSQAGKWQGSSHVVIHVEFADPDGYDGKVIVSRRQLSSIWDNSNYQSELFLLNALGASPESALGNLARFVQRIEDLSHCLFWSYDRNGKNSGVDLIELPRLNLEFYRSKAADGTYRLMSRDQSGMFISNTRSSSIYKLLKGLPHSILLENNDGNLGILLPSYLPIPRMFSGGSGWGSIPSSRSIADFRFIRNDRLWIDMMSARHFYYPLHLSMQFLFTPSVASTLYLLLVKFLDQRYEEVFELAGSMALGSVLSPDEEFLVTKLWIPELSSYELSHPDAHACRLKLLLIAAGSEHHLLRLPWNLEFEAKSYILKHDSVSVRCRFSLEDELQLLEMCSRPDIHILNRKNVLVGLRKRTRHIRLLLPPREAIRNEFDDIFDESCFDPGDTVKKLEKTNYERPNEEKLDNDAYSMMKAIDEWIYVGFDIVGTKQKHGFLLFYELMTGTLPLRILKHDDCYELGCLLVRLIPKSQYTQESVLMSILRMLVNNPEFRSMETIPLVEKKKNRAVKSKAHKVIIKDWEKWITDKDILWPEFAELQYDELTFAKISKNVPRSLYCPRQSDCSNANLSILPDEYSQEIENYCDFPLAYLDLHNYFDKIELQEEDDDFLDELPFNLWDHPYLKFPLAQSTLERLSTDFSRFKNQSVKKKIYALKSLSPEEIQSQKSFGKAISLLKTLYRELLQLRESDLIAMENGIYSVEEAANRVDEKDEETSIEFEFSRFAGTECTIRFGMVVNILLSSKITEDLRYLNPYLSDRSISELKHVTFSTILSGNRIGQIQRCLHHISELIKILQRDNRDESFVQCVQSASDILIKNLFGRRYYIDIDEDKGIRFDPRMLVFEFSKNILLRRSQVKMIELFVQQVGTREDPSAICHQMIMGAGKSTVISPLLSLLLADGNSILLVVVPKPLLEFSRSVMKECFSAVIKKTVYTFHFRRFQRVSPQLLNSLLKCKENRGVVLATPTAIKSCLLKFIELVHILDESCIKGEVDQQVLFQSGEQLKLLEQILEEFRQGVVIIDEVDVVLHPLKSELNFPVGEKTILDFSERIPGMGTGLRWEIPFFLLDGILFATERKFTIAAAVLSQSRQSERVLASIVNEVQEGIQKGYIQVNPHFVLISTDFYKDRLKHLMAQWLMTYLANKPHDGIDEFQIIKFLMMDGLERDQAARGSLEPLGVDVDIISDEFTKALNLSYDWLNYTLPFVLGKINRVTFGILPHEDVERFGENMPESRTLTSVPYVGKDVPSDASEFSHPDIVIGLTILGFRYSGLRRSDFKRLMQRLQDDMWSEGGPFFAREASICFEKWVSSAGGIVRGSGKLEPEKSYAYELGLEEKKPSSLITEVWPLHAIDLMDKDQFDFCYELLFNCGPAIHDYLHSDIFPVVMSHQTMQLSASGQEVGGSVLFERRIGFSGTPSELIPRELGECYYEKGSDGKMLQLLMNEKVVSFYRIGTGWSVSALLDLIANSEDPKYHALIDTGALITGMTNFQVASYLIMNGLSHMKGVVYLDKNDRKMILLRDNLKVVPLSQCGIDPSQRFTFYDQIHTTGMDIKQPLNCLAACTLGKDMTFRDYAQGAWRMRGIGNGQKLEILLIPEVEKLITSHMELAECVEVGILESICAWLILNGMKSEKIQFSILSQQDLSTLWRRRGLELLKEKFSTLGSEDWNDYAQSAIEVFRERLDYTVNNSVPPIQPLGQIIDDKIASKHHLLTADDIEVAQDIRYAVEAPIFMQDQDQVFKGEVVKENYKEKEQEQEQEQEREQVQQREQDMDEAIEIEKPIKRKYAGRHQDDVFWKAERLTSFGTLQFDLFNEEKVSCPFYTLSRFSVFKDLILFQNGGKSLEFPEFIGVSQNYYKKSWSTKMARRIKNTVIILEWIPDLSRVENLPARFGFNGVNNIEKIKSYQRPNVRRSFDFFDLSNSDTLNRDELGLALQSCDADLSTEEDFLDIMEKLRIDEDDVLKFDDFVEILENQEFHRIEKGRYYIAISLSEAESLRALMHIRADRSFLQSSENVALCLRTHNMILDFTEGYYKASDYMDVSAFQCLRFLDSNLELDDDREQSILLRSLQRNSVEERITFYKEIKSCRRRIQKDIEVVGLAPALTLRDEYQLLEIRSMTSNERCRCFGNENPLPVWNDAGSSGKPGSIWAVGQCNVMTVVAGHHPPNKTLYEIYKNEFWIKDRSILGILERGGVDPDKPKKAISRIGTFFKRGISRGPLSEEFEEDEKNLSMNEESSEEESVEPIHCTECDCQKFTEHPFVSYRCKCNHLRKEHVLVPKHRK